MLLNRIRMGVAIIGSVSAVFRILAAAAPQCSAQVHGAGATFPEPIYTKWFKLPTGRLKVSQ